MTKTNITLGAFAIVIAISTGLFLFGNTSPTLTNGAVIVLPITGDIGDGKTVSPDILLPTLKRYCHSGKDVTIVLKLNSGGGSPVAAERIIDTLTRHCGETKTIALVEGGCTSACLRIALYADEVLATPSSYVGGIGAMYEWNDYTAALDQAGIQERSIKSGPLKGGFTEAGNLSEDQVKNVQEVVDSFAMDFVLDVKQRRKGRLNDGANIALGGVYAASKARDIGLIDGLSTIEQLLEVKLKSTSTVYLNASEIGYSNQEKKTWVADLKDKVITTAKSGEVIND